MQRVSIHSANYKGQSLTPFKSVVAVSLLALTLSCSNNRYFQHEVETVRQRLQEHGNVAVQSAEPEHEGNSLRVRWEFQSEQPPARFLDWAASQLGQDYHVTSRTISSADFAKESPGDAVYLKLKVSPSASGSIVECMLQAMPD